MVSRPALSFVLMLGLLVAAPPGDARADNPVADVASSLSKGKFPWYDAEKDKVKPGEMPAKPREFNPATPASSGAGVAMGLGDVFSYVLMFLALAALLMLLVWLYRMYQPAPSEREAKKPLRPINPARIEDLPEEMRTPHSDDPWTEMRRCRERGDWNGAVLELFVHQLMSLHRKDLIRLAPGRTARQLVRSIRSPDFVPLVTPTLRLFEACYYGRRQITGEEFEELWSHSEAFERRLAQEVVA